LFIFFKGFVDYNGLFACFEDKYEASLFPIKINNLLGFAVSIVKNTNDLLIVTTLLCFEKS
jgi:hypothetical protein